MRQAVAKLQASIRSILATAVWRVSGIGPVPMIETLIPDVLAHAAQEQPREACGLAIVVKGRLKYWPCRNIAQSGEFYIAPEDYAAAEDAGEVVGVCHSHVYIPPIPSDADKVMCEQSGLPWLIVNWPTGTHQVIEPNGYKLPLIGRKFVHGVIDCYSLIRDYYAQELNISLPDFQRADNWWHAGQNLYLDNFMTAGFVRVDEVAKHDMLLMQVASPVPNHGAVYIGDAQIIQHCHGRLSSRDVYGGYWRKVTSHILRHKELL